MREEEEIFWLMGTYLSRTAVLVGARVVPTLCNGRPGLRHSQAWSCHCRHGPCQCSGHPRLNFFRFLESCSDNYLQNNLKQKKSNKIKAIKCVGCLPRSARLESLD